MLKIIKERAPEIIHDRYIEFLYKDDHDAGFMFPALPNGEPDLESMPPMAKENYYKCLTDDRLEAPKFIEDERTHMSPAVSKCSCGSEVVLDSGYMGAVQCKCGRWYNLFGQELKDPKYWEEEYI